ncbi:MAG: transaldolase [Ignavibacteriaceae bacterium]|nr:transaldolase [Ignavibacteriaceae bacterium]
MMKNFLQDIKTKIFADGADLKSIIEMNNNPLISGFTTNPTLMRKAGVNNYKNFALDVLSLINDKPVSFEVISDDFDEMERQALEISSWGKNVIVKIPITNTKKEISSSLVKRLCDAGVKINVTAVFTIEQMMKVLPNMSSAEAGYISIFAGRIADAGIDPLPIMAEAVEILSDHPKIELIWASPREVYNIIQADQVKCHIITATDDILKKLNLLGKDLSEFSLDTVKMFFNDAAAAGFNIFTDTEKYVVK